MFSFDEKIFHIPNGQIQGMHVCVCVCVRACVRVCACVRGWRADAQHPYALRDRTCSAEGGSVVQAVQDRLGKGEGVGLRQVARHLVLGPRTRWCGVGGHTNMCR